MKISSATLNPLPHVLRIEPASQCNLSCSHCPTGTVDMERGIMGEIVFEKVLSEIYLHKDSIKVIVLYCITEANRYLIGIFIPWLPALKISIIVFISLVILSDSGFISVPPEILIMISPGLMVSPLLM